MTPATKRPPRKADLARLAKLLEKWTEIETHLSSLGVEIVSGSSRSVRLRDMAALRDVLAYFEQS